MSKHQGGIESADTRHARRQRERRSAGWSWDTNRRAAQKLTALCLAHWGTLCHLCRTDGADTADHLIPRSKGGAHTLANLRPAHQACNAQRGDMDLAAWFAAHPLPRREALAPSREW